MLNNEKTKWKIIYYLTIVSFLIGMAAPLDIDSSELLLKLIFTFTCTISGFILSNILYFIIKRKTNELKKWKAIVYGMSIGSIFGLFPLSFLTIGGSTESRGLAFLFGIIIGMPTGSVVGGLFSFLIYKYITTAPLPSKKRPHLYWRKFYFIAFIFFALLICFICIINIYFNQIEFYQVVILYLLSLSLIPIVGILLGKSFGQGAKIRFMLTGLIYMIFMNTYNFYLNCMKNIHIYKIYGIKYFISNFSSFIEAVFSIRIIFIVLVLFFSTMIGEKLYKEDVQANK